MVLVRWYIARNRQKVGPFTGADLKQLAYFGLLQPEEHVWAEGSTKWVEAKGLAGLFPQEGQRRYWLNVEGKPRGPYVTDQIRNGLTAGQFNRETLVCPEGTTQWHPLNQVTEFRQFIPSPISPSQAQLLLGTLEIEEASLYLAGKAGDAAARLITTLMELKKNYAHNPALVESLEHSINILRAKRDEAAQFVPALV